MSKGSQNCAQSNCMELVPLISLLQMTNECVLSNDGAPTNLLLQANVEQIW